MVSYTIINSHFEVSDPGPEAPLVHVFCRLLLICFSKSLFRKIISVIPSDRVPTSSGNHGKPGKSLKKVPCMEISWNFVK